MRTTQLNVEPLEPRTNPAVPVTNPIAYGSDNTVYVISSLSTDLNSPTADRDLFTALDSWASLVPIHFKESDGPAGSSSASPRITLQGDPLADQANNVLAITTSFSSTLQEIRVRQADWADVSLVKILRHELGHALGLLHETDPNTSSVMQPYLENDADAPTQDDLTALHALYPPGVGDVTPFPSSPFPLEGIGVYDPNNATWYLRKTPSPGSAESFRYGVPGWLPIAGDWTGIGLDGVGVYDPSTGTFYLRKEASAGAPDAGVFRFGEPGWKPVIGDWDGTGFDKLGVYDPNTGNWYLAVVGGVKVVHAYGDAGMDPLGVKVGRVSYPMLYEPGSGLFYFDGKTTQYPSDYLPVVGRWDGNTGQISLGVVDRAFETWYLGNLEPFDFGAPGWLPLAGDWNELR